MGLSLGANIELTSPEWLDEIELVKLAYEVPGSGSPIVFDLDGDGIEVVSTANGFYFDFPGVLPE